MTSEAHTTDYWSNHMNHLDQVILEKQNFESIGFVDNYTLGVFLITIFGSLFLLGTLSLLLDSLVGKLQVSKVKIEKYTESNNKIEDFSEDLTDIDYSVDYDNLS